jgi:hypothetical protein
MVKIRVFSYNAKSSFVMMKKRLVEGLQVAFSGSIKEERSPFGRACCLFDGRSLGWIPSRPYRL